MKPHADLRSLRPDAGRRWWQSVLDTEGADVTRRFAETGTVYWDPADAMPIDLFCYIREASLCYSVAKYLATISLSGALVEIIINRDSRMVNRSGVRRMDGWATLNNQNLRLAEDAGLPAAVLVDEGESLGDPKPIRFVRLRNKVAHGDLKELPPDLTDYSVVYEQEAGSQLAKATRFQIDWFNSSPDIQSRDHGKP